jgi:hypothetical protein
MVDRVMAYPIVSQEYCMHNLRNNPFNFEGKKGFLLCPESIVLFLQRHHPYPVSSTSVS